VVESYLSSVWCGGQHPGRGGGHAATRHVNRWILLHGLRPQRVVSHALRETSQKTHGRGTEESASEIKMCSGGTQASQTWVWRWLTPR
jgi:hypothetical protein